MATAMTPTRIGGDGAPHHPRKQVTAELVVPERVRQGRALERPAMDISRGSRGV